MRNPNRLYTFYDKLRDLHIKHFPDWRFGQFISNFFGWLAVEKGVDAFFPEEDDILKYFEEYTGDRN